MIYFIFIIFFVERYFIRDASHKGAMENMVHRGYAEYWHFAVSRK